jgi:hypothetical protein
MFVFRGTANPEVVLAMVQPRKRIRGVIELWKVELVICWQEVTTVFVFIERRSAVVWNSRGQGIRAGVVGVRRLASHASLRLCGQQETWWMNPGRLIPNCPGQGTQWNWLAQ